MNAKACLQALILGFLLLPCRTWSADSIDLEEQRLSGFQNHKKKNKEFDKEREAGFQDWQREQELLLRQRLESEMAYRKRKREEVRATDESSPEYKAYINDKKRSDEDYEKARQEQVKLFAVLQHKRADLKRQLSEEEELDLNVDRPRFETRKRALFGAKNKWDKSGKGGFGGGSSSGGSIGGSSGSGLDNFIPPPPVDDFGDGFVPPPPMDFNNNMNNFNEVPPPPPPPMPGPFPEDYSPPPMFPDSFNE